MRKRVIAAVLVIGPYAAYLYWGFELKWLKFIYFLAVLVMGGVFFIGIADDIEHGRGYKKGHFYESGAGIWGGGGGFGCGFGR